MEIGKKPNNLNREDGLKLSQSEKPMIDNILNQNF